MTERTPRRLSARRLLHALSNMLIVAALAGGAFLWWDSAQRSKDVDTLRAAAPEGLFAEDSAFDDGAGRSRLDFAGYAAQDLAYWTRLKTGGVFGRMTASRIGLDAVVIKGHERAQLRLGPGWVAYSDLPGPTGNFVVSGHRTTNGAPFKELDLMKRGDTIVFYSPYRRYTYRVRRTFIVRPDRVDVAATTTTPMLTLTACHPLFSARQRIVLQADLIDVRRLR